MSGERSFSWKHCLMAVAGAAAITWLAASVSPAPRLGMAAREHAAAGPSAGGHRPAPGYAAERPPAPLRSGDAPPPAAPATAAAPRGRSYKCVSGGAVTYADRPCAEGAESSLVNVNPALVGAVPPRQ